MKKLTILLALLLCISPYTAYAVTPRAITIVPSINFVGNTANCSVSITANSFNDDIVATVRLWEGISCIAIWNASGSGFLNINRSMVVSKGVEYGLTVDVTINGLKKPTVSTNGTC